MSTNRPRRSGTGWFLAGYVGLTGFFALEAAVRKPGSAASLDATKDDQGTTRTIVTAYAVATMLSPILRRTALPQLPRVAAPAGLALQAAGLTVRAWSMRTLGTAYSRTLRTEDQRGVVDAGPYRLVRHPGYTGSLLTSGRRMSGTGVNALPVTW